MTHPLDDPDGVFRVLANHEAQHCLWPSCLDIPPGWHSVFGPAGRADCLAAIERLWTDLRPMSQRPRRQGVAAPSLQDS